MKFCEMMRKAAIFELGAMQKRATLVYLEECCKMNQNCPLVAEAGFDIAENGPSKIPFSYSFSALLTSKFRQKKKVAPPPSSTGARWTSTTSGSRASAG